LLWQSEFAEQERPLAQSLQEPPQSTSVSFPLRIPSVQLGARQVPLRQLPLAQSLFTVHVRFTAHGEQDPPPQSTSDSEPFFRASSHRGPFKQRWRRAFAVLSVTKQNEFGLLRALVVS
jgi:hypothetical protein